MEKQIVHSKLCTILFLSNFLKSYCCCVDPNLYLMSTTISKPDSVLWTLFLYASATNSDEESVIFSPSLKGGCPRYGQPLQRNASPSPQFPQADWGLLICEGVSTADTFFSSSSARPHEQFLQAFFPTFSTLQSSATAVHRPPNLD
jgi:hypothetical protein